MVGDARMTVLVRIAYDGTDFHGFARQSSAQPTHPAAATSADPAASQPTAPASAHPTASAQPTALTSAQPTAPASAHPTDPARPVQPVRTVQGCLEDALAGLYRRPVVTRAASRTDAGVHALGQIVGFEPPLAIPPKGVVLGPPDIGVLAAWHADAPDGGPVDPRFWNNGKLYRYRIRTTAHRVPQTHRHEWHLPRALDVPAMQAAARHFIGEHDFAGFRAAACQARTTVRRVLAVDVHGGPAGDPLPRDPACLPPAAGPELVTIAVRGEAFLQNMVRIMVGTLVDVGAGRRDPDDIAALLAAPDRQRSGATAPPQGLTLVEVLWPDSWPPPPRSSAA
jgi:tRNA pseudouridine38-40 synthase